MKSKTLFYLFLLTLLTSLIPAMHAQTFSVIHTFTGSGVEGGYPQGVTIRGNALYGTTILNNGTVYQLTQNGSNWLFSSLATLYPYSNVNGAVFGPDGHLYGTAYSGGPYSFGAAFKLTPPVGICKTSACYWTVNSLHDFGSGTDGRSPANGDLIWDQQGNIYGTTLNGGTSQNCDPRCGTVYELTPPGNGYTESVLYNFSGPDGEYPYAGLVLDKNGNLFGAASGGGLNQQGLIFELSYVVGVGWTQNVLYTFQNASDGAGPKGGLIFDSAGNLYGTTVVGGSGGGGTVFELSPSGNTWIFKLLYSFSGPNFVTCGPSATLAMDGAGNLYGTTYCEFANPVGNVFELANTENGWVYTSLPDFTGGSDGMFPRGNLSIGTDGALYGVTAQGGDHGFGVVWMIKP